MKRIMAIALSVMLATAAALPASQAAKAATVVPKPAFKRVEEGKYFSAGLTADGTLSIWGNLEGMNGQAYVPVFGKAKDWADVSAGLVFVTAIKKDGTMWSWGTNDVGQVGNGTTKNALKPTQIGKNKQWKTVSSNYAHSLAIARDGTLWGWGYNPYGEVGNGNHTNQSKPVQIGKDKDWDRVVAGEFFSLGVKKDGTVYSWGAGGSGALGTGTTASRSTPTKIGKENWKALSAGSVHALALKADGTLWGWGYNGYGQIGVGTNKDVLKPTRIGKEADWVAIAASDSDSFAVKKDGTLWGWGETYGNKPRQLGLDRDWSALAKIAAGAKRVMVQKKDGTLWGWGDNASGQLRFGIATVEPWEMLRVPMEASPTAPSKAMTAEMTAAKKHRLLKQEDLYYYKSDVTRRLASRLFVDLYKSLTWDADTEPRATGKFEDLLAQDTVVAYQSGFVEAFSKDAFGLYEPLTREDFLTGLYRVLQASHLTMDPLPRQWAKAYSDANGVSAKAKEALQYLDQAGLLREEAGKLRPTEAISREEAFAYLWRAYETFFASTAYSAGAKAVFYDLGYRIEAGKDKISESYRAYDEDDAQIANWEYVFPRTDGTRYNRDEALPSRVTVLYAPGQDEYKLDVIRKIIETDAGVPLPSLKQSLLDKFDELRIDDIAYAENTGEQYLTVDGKRLLVILFNESKTKERILEVDY